MARILVVDDEPDIALGLRLDLQDEGHQVEVAGDGELALARAREPGWDLIVLDVMLPLKDGFEVCRDLRRARIRTPVLMLTAKAQEAEKVMGLDMGADDYVTKPFSPRELRARVRALLRRAEPDQPAIHRIGDCEVDLARAELRRNGSRTDLTAIELKMLQMFLHSHGRVLSRAQVVDQVWGQDVFVTDRVVDTHVVKLRRKVEPDPAAPDTSSASGALATGSRHDNDTNSSQAPHHRGTPGRYRGTTEEIDMRTLTAVVVALVLLAGGAITQERRPQDVALQAAIRTETVDGDLENAIKQFGDIAEKYKSDRSTVATALVHLAGCYQKRGDAQANAIYERIVREFADQKDAVTIARARLGNTDPAVRTNGMAYRRVWADSGKVAVDLGGSVSQDGRYLSYIDWNAGDLMLRDLAAGTDRRLIGNGTWRESSEYAEQSALSRDGNQVAYAWFNGKDRYQLRVADLKAAPLQPRTVLDQQDVVWIAPYDWSPDGRSDRGRC